MGNSWTRLVQEAAKHGGPNGLRQHYANLGANATRGNGRLSGFFIGTGTLLAGATMGWAADKVIDRFVNRKADAVQISESVSSPSEPDGPPSGSALPDLA